MSDGARLALPDGKGRGAGGERWRGLAGRPAGLRRLGSGGWVVGVLGRVAFKTMDRQKEWF